MSGYHRPHRTHGVADLSEVLLARRSRLQNRRTHESVKGFRLQVFPMLCWPDAHGLCAPVVSPDGVEPSLKADHRGERKGASIGSGSGKGGKVKLGGGADRADAVINPVTKRSPRSPQRSDSGGIAKMSSKVPFGGPSASVSSSDVENDSSRPNNLAGVFEGTTSGADSSTASETNALLGRARRRRTAKGAVGGGEKSTTRENSTLLSDSFKDRYR